MQKKIIGIGYPSRPNLLHLVTFPFFFFILLWGARGISGINDGTTHHVPLKIELLVTLRDDPWRVGRSLAFLFLPNDNSFQFLDSSALGKAFREGKKQVSFARKLAAGGFDGLSMGVAFSFAFLAPNFFFFFLFLPFLFRTHF